MPDNSFEHNMSRQMEDFNYPASDAVWQKLEVNLQKRKKRRWATIWFLSGLVLVGAGIYFMARPSNQNKEISLISNSVKTDISENLPANPKNYSTDKSSSEKSELIVPVSKSLRKNSMNRQVVVKKDYKYNRQEISEKSAKNIIVDSDINKDVEVEKNEEAPPVLTADPLLEKVSEIPVIETPVADSVSAPKTSDSFKESDSDIVAKIPPAKEPSKRSLSFGIRFEAGRSANSELNFAKTTSADLAAGPMAGGPQAYAYPFTQEPSFAWSFGAWIRKPISQRVNMQTGLTYHHYRTRASQGDSSNYTNTFHLLSVPIEIALQINKGKKLPVQWHFGIEPGWMVGSNITLQDTSGYLYNDKSKINRFQMGIQTGVSFRLFQKSKHALELGPVFQYMLTPAFKSGSLNDGHLNFLGLRADWKIR